MREHGYCVEDVARLPLVAHELARRGEEGWTTILYRSLAFLTMPPGHGRRVTSSSRELVSGEVFRRHADNPTLTADDWPYPVNADRRGLSHLTAAQELLASPLASDEA